MGEQEKEKEMERGRTGKLGAEWKNLSLSKI